MHVEGNAGTDYRSLYFDTKDLQHYHDHHNRRTFRNKVRFREYLGSGLVYLEVKKKTGRGRTNKKRMKVAGIPDQLSPEQSAFIAKHCRRNDEMVPTIWNHFTRYTFVDRNGSERLTMDVQLRFTDAATDKELGGVVIAELKQAATGKLVISDRLTPLLAQALRSQKPQPSSQPDFDSLTPREKDILRLIAEGLSNKMIGRRLDISDGTVKVHVKHLLKKLNLRSRVEVAVWAVEEGLHKG